MTTQSRLLANQERKRVREREREKERAKIVTLLALYEAELN